MNGYAHFASCATVISMTDRPKHRVSVKVALLNETKDQVLMTVLSDGRLGVPGGHIEGLEQPRDALERELSEELGLRAADYNNVTQTAVWREAKGDRLIIGYTAQLNSDAVIRVDPTEVADSRWVTREDVERGGLSITYDDFLRTVFV